jgi:hypothetical protein
MVLKRSRSNDDAISDAVEDMISNVKKAKSVMKGLSDAVKAAEGVIDARIMHIIINHAGNLDDTLKSALTDDDAIVLIQLGADASTPAGTAAVIEAAKNKRDDVIRVLLQHGATATGNALLAAVTNRHLPSVKLLAEHNAGCDTYMVFVAANNGDDDILDCILHKAPSDAGLIALAAAIRSDKVDVVRALVPGQVAVTTDIMMMDMSPEVMEVLEKHVEVTADMVLRAVTEEVCVDVLKMLIRRSDFVSPDEMRPALHTAIMLSDEDSVEILLGADVPITEDMVLAAADSRDEIKELLHMM